VKKIGILILALVFALGSLGVGYAMWWDRVYIDGDVSTGCVDLTVDSVSGTWVYKNIASGAVVYSSSELNEDTNGDGIDELLYVARAVAAIMDEYAEEDEEIFITLDNIFPTFDYDETLGWVEHPLIADVLFLYDCTVPAHISWETTAPCSEYFENYLIWKWTVTDAAGDETVYYGTEITGVQLHMGYSIYLEVYFDPGDLQWNEDLDLQNMSCSFLSEFYVHQWNEDW